MSHYHHRKPHKQTPFLFPRAQSTVLPDPSDFFAPSLLSNPKPTNSFFQNFVLKNGDQPEYIHPYLIKSADSSLTLSYPTRFSNPAFIYQVFNADLSVSAAEAPPCFPAKNHVVTAFDGLSVTLDIPSAGLRAFLVRGSPYVTVSISGGVSLKTIHAILSLSPNESRTRHALRLNNGQTWIVYSSSPVELRLDGVSRLTSAGGFSGILRIAAVPDPDPRSEAVLDRFSSCYPVSGEASFAKPFCVEYRWETKGWGELLMLAHPLHLNLLSEEGCVVSEFKYRSIDGDLVGVVGAAWTLQTQPARVAWHSANGLPQDSKAEIASALRKDVSALDPDPAAIATSSSYFYGKQLARAARLALIAEEACFPEAAPRVAEYLRRALTPWLDGTFPANGFHHDDKWGGIVTRQGISDAGADFGFGIYNDHHYHLGYFLYAAAVLAKLDPDWGRRFRPHCYAMAADIASLDATGPYTPLRCFDAYKLHSWAGGLTEFGDGRNQESTSEAVNAYHALALLGLAHGDPHAAALGSSLAALEAAAASTWWLVPEGGGMYEAEFTRANRAVGVLWANKRDSGLWFAPPEWKECRLGIQLLPLTPASEAMYEDSAFAREIVEWTEPALRRDGVGEGWKGFVYALQALYDRQPALARIRALTAFDDGNSLSNLLWWAHTRAGADAHCSAR